MSQQDSTNLTYLVRLGLVTLALQIDELFYSRLDEEVVTSAGPLPKAKTPQEVAEVSKPNICVRSTSKDQPQQILLPRHEAIVPITLR